MDVTQSNHFSADSKPGNWDRRDIAARLAVALSLADSGLSQQQCAGHVAVPRSTLQNWMRNRNKLEQQVPLSTNEVQFFRIIPRARVPTQNPRVTPFDLRPISRLRNSEYLLVS